MAWVVLSSAVGPSPLGRDDGVGYVHQKMQALADVFGFIADGEHGGDLPPLLVYILGESRRS